MNPFRRLRRLFHRLFPPPSPHAFLRQSSGIIHIGANIGQEAPEYGELGLPVLWVEPIPWIFEELGRNISPYPNQSAVQALLLREPQTGVTLHISSNHGASSSVLDLADHRKVWPEVHYVKTLQLDAITLDELLVQNPAARSHNTLVLDTQGTELDILRGGVLTLTHTDFVKTEVADFESYAGGCHLKEMDEFLASQGFVRKQTVPFASVHDVGTYFDVLYVRKSPRR